MKKTEINWKSGEIVFWDIDSLNANIPIDSQPNVIENDLKEDLVLVRFGKDIILDLGWYPEFNPKGQFVLSVVKHENWENPILQLKFRDTAKVKQSLNQAIEIANSDCV